MAEIFNHKFNEQHVLPDDYTDLQDGNANTASDKAYNAFVYAEERVGNVTKPVRRAVVIDQPGPEVFPENPGNPQIDPDLTGNTDPRNGVGIHAGAELPSLQQKIDEAEAILSGRGSASSDPEKETDRDRYDISKKDKYSR